MDIINIDKVEKKSPKTSQTQSGTLTAKYV